MKDGTRPDAKFQRFEKVLVTDREGALHPGTVLWRDDVRYDQSRPGFKGLLRTWWDWEYLVHVPDRDCTPTLKESQLRAAGHFDPEEDHLGKRFEISFDFVQLEDMTIVDRKYRLQLPLKELWIPIEDFDKSEGSYRIPGKFWQVYDFAKRDVPELRHEFGVCESGITGVAFEVPNEVALTRDYQIRAMSTVFDTRPESWIVARGPCSDILIGDGRAGL